MAERPIPPGYVKIVRIVSTCEERSSIRGRSYSWSCTYVHTITGECGHVKVARGMSHPKKSFLCHDCRDGKPRVEVTGPLGRIDARSGEVKDPLGRALLDNMRAEARARA